MASVILPRVQACLPEQDRCSLTSVPGQDTLPQAQMTLSVLGCGSQGLPPHRRKNMKRASHRITEVPSSALPSRLGSWVGTVFGHATSVKKSWAWLSKQLRPSKAALSPSVNQPALGTRMTRTYMVQASPACPLLVYPLLRKPDTEHQRDPLCLRSQPCLHISMPRPSN